MWLDWIRSPHNGWGKSVWSRVGGDVSGCRYPLIVNNVWQMKFPPGYCTFINLCFCVCHHHLFNICWCLSSRALQLTAPGASRWETSWQGWRTVRSGEWRTGAAVCFTSLTPHRLGTASPSPACSPAGPTDEVRVVSVSRWSSPLVYSRLIVTPENEIRSDPLSSSRSRRSPAVK